MIRRVTSPDVSYSVADFAGTARFFITAAPARGMDLPEQTLDCLRSVARITDDQDHGTLVQQAVFVRSDGDAAICRDVLRAFYGARMPATTFVLQPACRGTLVQIEAWGIAARGEKVLIDWPCDGLVVARHHGLAWAHAAQSPSPAANIYDQSLNAFHRISQTLASGNFRYSQVIRTWLYVGDILGPEGDVLRYNALNRGRTEFYQNHSFSAHHAAAGKAAPVYPASTAIGAAGQDLAMSCIALATDRSDVPLAPLENPLQVSACEYAQEHAPKFARAMAVCAGDAAIIFVSGTSSITDEESRHPDDLQKQVQQTLDNIATVIAKDNLAGHGLPGMGATLDDVALLRVYVKRPEDFSETRRICGLRVGGAPTTYAVGDICRPELLIEIEAVAFAQRR